MQQLVLLIDDDGQMLSVLEYALGAAGMGVRVASSGPAGIALARQLHPDLIVLDLNMPGMGGAEVVRHLRAENGTASVPVLAFTSAPLESGVCSDLIARGFTACLSKQSGLEELMQTVRMLSSGEQLA